MCGRERVNIGIQLTALRTASDAPRYAALHRWHATNGWLIRRAWILEGDIMRNHDSILAKGQPSGVDSDAVSDSVATPDSRGESSPH